jgi:hypothetical protein
LGRPAEQVAIVVIADGRRVKAPQLTAAARGVLLCVRPLGLARRGWIWRGVHVRALGRPAAERVAIVVVIVIATAATAAVIVVVIVVTREGSVSISGPGRCAKISGSTIVVIVVVIVVTTSASSAAGHVAVAADARGQPPVAKRRAH